MVDLSRKRQVFVCCVLLANETLHCTFTGSNAAWIRPSTAEAVTHEHTIILTPPPIHNVSTDQRREHCDAESKQVNILSTSNSRLDKEHNNHRICQQRSGEDPKKIV